MGDLKSPKEIIAAWKNNVSDAFKGCLNETEQVILAPSKTTAFQPNGLQANYFQPYTDAIWNKYKNEDLIFKCSLDDWKGRAINDSTFEFTKIADNTKALITRRPTTIEILEAKGIFDGPSDHINTKMKVQFCGALNRHAIDLTTQNGVMQDWGDVLGFIKPFLTMSMLSSGMILISVITKWLMVFLMMTQPTKALFSQS